MFELEVDATGLMAKVQKPEEIRFWIENEIGDYGNISVDAENWCNTSVVGETYIGKEDLIKVSKIN